MIGDKGLYNAQDLHDIERKLSDGEDELKADFFDDAETNQDIQLYPDVIGFEDELAHIGADLDELRKNRTHDLIPDSLISSALNVYIENALTISKKQSLIDVSGWETPEEPQSADHLSNEERRLSQRTKSAGKSKAWRGGENMLGSKEGREKGLLSLAESNRLFDINLDQVYESVGPRQLDNFAKLYGTKTAV